jgi:uncharacterized protein YbbC (DUF1343 family)
LTGKAKVRSGLEALLEGGWLRKFVGLNLGLIVNHTSVTGGLEPSYLLLRERGINVKAIFTPEHGLWGAYQAGELVNSESQPLKGVKVHSLYGAYTKPSGEMLDGLDLIAYDIQDVGCRTYTYISTMLGCLEEASKRGIDFVILDRPDPLGGTLVEGPVLKWGLESFVGPYYIPLRYGLTPGELGILYALERGLSCPKVVRMSGWGRAMYYGDTGMPWIYPSPAIPTPTSALLYSGMCLLEATNLSEGRGTYKPFEVFGAPWLNSAKLVDVLKSRLGGECRPMEVRFIPASSKYMGKVCKGVYLIVGDVRKVRSFEIIVRILQAVLELHPNEFEVDYDKMDRLLGDREVREDILSGVRVDEIALKLKDEQKEFKNRVREILLYD